MAFGNLRYETKPEKEWLQVIGENDTAKLKARPIGLNTSCDWPYVGGTSVSGRTAYIDQQFYREVMDGRVAVKGMTPRQIVQAIIEHEHTEKAIMDGDNPVDTYPAAHEYATTAEHHFVKQLGVDPQYYEDCLKPAIERCLRRAPENLPRDVWCGPLLDEPTEEDKRILRQLRAKGVIDASKLSKESVRYGMGAHRCEDCTMMQRPAKALSQCDLVSGLVRNNRNCDRYVARAKSDAVENR